MGASSACDIPLKISTLFASLFLGWQDPCRLRSDAEPRRVSSDSPGDSACQWHRCRCGRSLLAIMQDYCDADLLTLNAIG